MASSGPLPNPEKKFPRAEESIEFRALPFLRTRPEQGFPECSQGGETLTAPRFYPAKSGRGIDWPMCLDRRHAACPRRHESASATRKCTLRAPIVKSVSQSQSSATAGSVESRARTWQIPRVRDPLAAEKSDPAHVAKRALDVGLSTLLILLTSPVLVAAVAVIILVDGEPPIFKQRRVGLRGREFSIFKLRTMGDGPGPSFSGERVFEKARDDDRVTAVGAILRRFSVDELPQLFNVLRGEMSLVGPRPLLLRDMKRFPPGRPMRRFDMKPGLTGLWQVSGRSLLSDEERIRLDIDYVERWSLWLDINILLRTPWVVLSGRGAF